MDFFKRSVRAVALSGGLFAGLFLGALVPQLALAQSYPYAILVVNTQTQSGIALPSSTVTVTAAGASLSGSPSGSNTVSFASNFGNDTHVVTFSPGAYSISAAPVSGYYFSYSSGCSGSVLNNGGTATCLITALPQGTTGGSAALTVYTQVLNNSYTNAPYQPANFTISVVGNSPNPSVFQGNQAGTAVTLGPGAFSVNPTSVSGWYASESGDCSSTIQNGQNLSCTVTYSYAYNNYPYNQYPYNQYPYNQSPYYPTTLTCQPNYQQVALGQSAMFTAQGGAGTYNWSTPDRNYISVGPVLTTTFQNAGTQTVVVSSGTQTATCMVNVTANTYIPTYYSGGTSYSGSSGSGTVAQTNVPSLPNTGFAPQNGAALAFAVVFLAAAAIALYPYVTALFVALLG